MKAQDNVQYEIKNCTQTVYITLDGHEKMFTINGSNAFDIHDLTESNHR